MKQEKQRIVIAEVCGWKNILRENSGEFGGLRGDKNGERKIVPSYCRDLNATHEMKKTLTDEQRPIYWRTLYEVCKTTEWPFNAEAHQEAEAFLRALNKWEDS